MNKKQKAALTNEAGKCVYCGSKEELTVDHIIPRSFCTILRISQNDKMNLQVLCEKCNKHKANNLKSNCPPTTKLMKMYLQRWLWLNGADVSRRKYVFRTLPVKSHNPEPTEFYPCDKLCQLKLIYEKQIGKR